MFGFDFIDDDRFALSGEPLFPTSIDVGTNTPRLFHNRPVFISTSSCVLCHEDHDSDLKKVIRIQINKTDVAIFSHHF